MGAACAGATMLPRGWSAIAKVTAENAKVGAVLVEREILMGIDV